MSSLNSASSLDDIRAAYADNASYAEDHDTGKCRRFITACRLLLLDLPKRASHGGTSAEEVELDLEVLRGEIQHAQSWLASASERIDADRSTRFDVNCFRD
ncbi:MAG: hypothetical protein ABSG68_08655 [Thermoguttaceae bacterium]|jgi:hypothetical protein